MKVGLAGYSGSGKSTVFQWLTGKEPDPAATVRGQIGHAEVVDDRLAWLSAQFKPKKTTPARLEFVDCPGLIATDRDDNPRRLALIREADGLLVVLNGFSGGTLAADLTTFREELLFADLDIVSNRVKKLTDQLKKAKPAKEKEADQHEYDLLKRMIDAFEAGKPASALGLKEDEEKAVRSFQLLTLKPEVVLVNLGDQNVSDPLPADLLALAPTALKAPVKLELELADLPAEDRAAFMADLGMTGFRKDETIRDIYAAMDRMVFFTVGEDECRAWPLWFNATAVEGAGQIHTDLAKRFVRAEVVGYDDFRRVGSMKEAKAQGVYRLEGKTYIVKDGDIMHIL